MSTSPPTPSTPTQPAPQPPGIGPRLARYSHRTIGDLHEIEAALPLRLALAVAALAVNVFFYLPRTPAAAEAVSFPGADKAFHVLVFALTVWAVGRLLAPARRFPIGWVAIGALANALLIEAVQGLFLPERSADVGDLVADAVGIVLGLVAWWYERRRRAVADAEF